MYIFFWFESFLSKDLSGGQVIQPFWFFFIKKEDDNTITITMYTTYFWETPQNIIFLSEKIFLLPPAIYMGFLREMNTYLR